MPNATYEQTNFLGGEWSPAAQGRTDDPRYTTALAQFKNAYPTEQGAWTRRDGSQGIIPTRNRNYAKLLGLEMGGQLPYILEFTDGSLRFYYGTSPTYTNDPKIVSSSAFGGGNLTLGTTAAHGYSVGDDVMLFFAIDKPPADEGNFRGVVLQCMAGSTGSTLVLGDETGNLMNSNGFSNLTLDGSELVFRIQRRATVINSTNYPSTINTVLQQLRVVSLNTLGLVVQGNLAPQQITITTAPIGVNDAQFAIAAATFQDGPYAAMESGGGSVSALSGTITFTPASGTFVADDVGKHIRLFSEPPAWASGTTYSAGALVKYQGAYYSSTQGSNTGNTPGAPTVVSGVLSTFWNPVLNVQRWVWGTISAQSGSACTVVLGADLSTVNGLPTGATNVIPTANGTASITAWQRGLWSPTNGYPINGSFHEGRLFLFGPIGNRWDASVSNAVLTFSTTDQYGNVNDNNALSETLNTSDVMYWGRADDRGIVVGAQKGEWLISASVEGEAMTPTNAKARRVTRYRCAAIDPVEAGQSLVLVQFYKKHLYEYLIDSFSGRFQGKPLNDLDLPITNANMAELAVTLEPTPRVWVRNQDGSLVTCTYRRISRFITEAPVFDAMNPHSIGDGRIVETLCGVSDPGGGDTACNSLLDPSLPLPDATATGDYLYLVTNDAVSSETGGSSDRRMVEVIVPQLEADDFTQGRYVDQTPGGGKHIVATALSLASGYCTQIGGLKGSDSQTGEPADIGNRAIATPGVTLPSSGTTRAADLAILNNAVWFNGYTTLYNLPRLGNSTTGFSMSVWLNLNEDNADHGNSATGPSSASGVTAGVGGCRGVILGGLPIFRGTVTTPDSLVPDGPVQVTLTDISGSPDFTTGRTMKITGPAHNSDGSVWLTAGQVRWCKPVVKNPSYHSIPGLTSYLYRGAMILPLFGATPTSFLGNPYPVFMWEGNVNSWVEPVPSEAINGFRGLTDSGVWANWEPNDVANPPLTNGNSGWFNLLVSVIPDGSGGWNFQMYVNDTVIWDTLANLQNPVWSAPWLPFGDLQQWYIGGRNAAAKQNGGANGSMRDFKPDDGAGLVAGMSELWIAPTPLDFSVGANRAKFHTNDTLLATYAPVDLGAQGKTPTGSKPWIYCTGPTSLFHLNRARKNAALTVYNPIASSGTHPTGGHGFTAFVDAWLGHPVT